MSTFLALYRKELKFLTKPFVVLVIIHIAGIVCLLLTDIPEYGDSWSFNAYVDTVKLHFAFLDFFMYGSVFLIPFLLGYSYYEEWSDRTSLQLLSLPASRSAVAWSKYYAVMTLGLFVPIGILIYHYLYDIKISPHIGQYPQPFSSHVIFAFFTLCVITWIAGVLSVSAGVMTSVRTYRLAISITVFMVLSAVSWGMLHVISSSILSHSQTGLSDAGVYSGSGVVIRGIILVIESIFILFAGHNLFERYVEA